MVGSEAVKGIARRQHWHVPRQGLRHLDLYAGRKFERDHHRVDHSVELGAIVEKAELFDEWMIFKDPLAHIAGDDHFHRNIVEHDKAGKNRQKASKIDDIDRIVRS